MGNRNYRVFSYDGEFRKDFLNAELVVSDETILIYSDECKGELIASFHLTNYSVYKID